MPDSIPELLCSSVVQFSNASKTAYFKCIAGSSTAKRGGACTLCLMILFKSRIRRPKPSLGKSDVLRIFIPFGKCADDLFFGLSHCSFAIMGFLRKTIPHLCL